MFFQIGDKEFEGQFSPNMWDFSGSEANYAEHAIINGKPRLQHTGETLEEVALNFKLRAEFCNPDQEIKDFQAWKSEGTILPLLVGNGEYKNDYVIRSVGYNVTQTLNDGTIVEANVYLNLVEHVPADPEEQQAKSDRAGALAVGDKEQVVRRPGQKRTPEAEAHAALMAAQLETWEANEAANKALDSGSPENFVDKVKKSIADAQRKMSDARDKIQGVQNTVNGVTGIVGSIQQSIAKLGEIATIMTPPINLQNLNDSILNSQTALRLVADSGMTFTQSVILRRF